MRKLNYPILLLAVTLSIFSSCKKDSSPASKTTTTSTSIAGTIAIGTVSEAATATTAASKDTLYLVNCFTPHSKPDSVAFSALPAAIGTYLTANYSGYTFKHAFQIVDSLHAASGYIVVIDYNGSPVGLKFTAAGVFVQVLEQMVGPAPGHGPGGHNGPGGMDPNGGPFHGRDGGHPDTIALSAIPTAVESYFAKTYPSDTLLHASIACDSTYVLISKNDGLYATAITKTGALVNRIKLPAPPGPPAPVAQSALPAAITTYLTTTYPGYVFENAFAIGPKGSVLGYDVLILANTTKYVVSFNASGVLLKAAVIH